jgi:hypothetical protein
VRARLAFVSLLCWALWACAETASPDPGTRALLRVAEGQFIPGKLPSESGGPELLATRLAHDRIVPAAQGESFAGTLGEHATAVVLGLDGDVGHWVVTAGPAALTEPDFPTFSATLSFARSLRTRALTLRVAAVDARGRIGPFSSELLTVSEDAVDSPLVVRLRWDNGADLDLHLLLPNGEEIFAGNINAQVAAAPGQPASDPNAFRDAGVLNFDANANCVIGGRSEERITFPSAPAAGEYVVRVATASLCGESVAHFHVEALLDSVQVGAAEGTCLAQDTRGGRGRGAGLYAFSFRVP